MKKYVSRTDVLNAMVGRPFMTVKEIAAVMGANKKAVGEVLRKMARSYKDLLEQRPHTGSRKKIFEYRLADTKSRMARSE